MAVILIGYDVEAGGRITREFLKKAQEVHLRLGVPCTLFLRGQVVEFNTEDLLKVPRNELFDLQQHTYSHLPLKTVVQQNENGITVVRGISLEEIHHEIRKTSKLLKELLGVDCRGLTGPYGYYRGLSDRPDILEILYNLGIRFTRTYGRNRDDWQPVPFDVQPFWYEPQGFGEILEFPIQGWQDCLWRKTSGEYSNYLKAEIDRIAQTELVWNYLQHDFITLRDDSQMKVTQGFIEYARDRGIRFMRYIDYYQEELSLKGSNPPKGKTVESLTTAEPREGHSIFVHDRVRILVLEPKYNDTWNQVAQDCIGGFKKLGCIAEEVELRGAAVPWELDFQKGLIGRISEFRPDFLLSLNHAGLNPELLARIELPYAVWFWENPLYYLSEYIYLQRYLNEYLHSGHAVFFLAERTYIEQLRSFGFDRLFLLPMATNPKRYRKIELSEDEIKRFGCDFSFSTDANYLSGKKRIEVLEKALGFDLGPILEETLQIKLQNPSLDLSGVLKIVQDSLGSHIPYRNLKERMDFEEAASLFIQTMRQKEIIEATKDLGLHLYADRSWKELLNGKIEIFDRLDITEEAKLYSASRINLNILGASNQTSLNQKTYDIAACGAFSLTEYRPGLEGFKMDEEMIFYEMGDLEQKVKYYLAHPEERQEIARRGQERVLKEHTYRHRMEKLISIMREIYG